MKGNYITGCLQSIELFNEVGLNGKKVPYQLSVDLLKEEVNEYKTASDVGSRREVRDALGDIFYVLWGVVMNEGLIDEFWDIVGEICESNLSKFDTTQEDAEQSVFEYLKKGISVRWEYNEKHKLYVIRRADGKILKSHNWKPPVLSDL